ncbi:MAG: MFS transporter [Pseudomonadota bacterium]
MTDRASSIPYPPARQANTALALLLLAYILSFIDRNIMAMLVMPIRESFNISDFEFSLLHGFAFTLLYIGLGLPIGRYADSHKRVGIVAAGVMFWSLMTCLCGFAKNFIGLFFARVGVGVGEAALSPPAYSLLSDYFEPGKLRWATSIYAMGITLGGGLAYMIGGHVFEYFSTATLPEMLQGFEAWQLTFIAVGLPGVALSIAIALLKEPARQQTTLTQQGSDSIPLSEIRAYLGTHWQAFTAIFAAVSLMSMIGYGHANWFPSFLQRTHNMPLTEAGTQLGLMSIFAGTPGALFGALAATWVRKRGYVDANLRVVGLAAALLILPAPLATLVPDASTAIALLWFTSFVHYTYFGISLAALMAISPNRMRAQMSALLLFMANLFGLALGGSLIAGFTNFVYRDDMLLNLSLSTVAGIVYPATAVVVFWGLRYYRRALEAVTA